MGRAPAVLFLLFCALTATAQARPRTLADAITGTGHGGEITLRDAGSALLAGIVAMQPPSLAPQPVEVKLVDRDRYGRARVIAYREGQHSSLQEEWLRTGRALVYDRAPTPAAWLAAERDAEVHRRGVWGQEGFVRPVGQLTAEAAGLVLVEGKVTRSYKGREMWYVNFGEDWKTDASLRIPRRAWRSMGQDFAVADGQCLRARGAVFQENGPMIEITRPEQLEFKSCVAPQLREPRSSGDQRSERGEGFLSK